MVVIHICGAPASGKTTLGNELRKNKKIVVKDLDDVLAQYLRQIKRNKFTVDGYQKYLDGIIGSPSKKPVVLVGINGDMGRSSTTYRLNADHKFFIDLDVKENAKRRFVRDYKNDVEHFFMWQYNGKPNTLQIYNEWTKNENQSTHRLQEVIKDMSPAGLEKDTMRWRARYKKLGYVLKSKEKILDAVKRLCRI